MKEAENKIRKNSEETIYKEKFDYWMWPNVINEDQIEKINSICKESHDPFLFDVPAIGPVKNVNVKNIQWKYLKSILSDVLDTWLDKNKHIFGYSLFPVKDNDFLNINIYDSLNQGEYGWHLDGSNNHVYDVKLTGILNISDEPYEGGEFSCFCGEFITLSEIRKPGSLLLLNHKVLHKVGPVTKGKRKTLSLWFAGPKFI